MSTTDRPIKVVARKLREKLVAEMVAAGTIRSNWVRSAFETVPREVFVPRFHYWDGTRRHLVEGTDPGRRDDWLHGVYTDQVLQTQLIPTPDVADPDGMPSSSSSMPTVMAGMLEALDLQVGHRVLEIGTGTGYNAALLAQRVGGDHVTSIELDPRLADAARETLAGTGLYPAVHTGDGATGLPQAGPFDRICVTAAVDHVPPAWIEQLAPGGVVVANLRGSIGGGVVRLTRSDDDRDGGEVVGPFLDMAAAFMPMRTRVDSPHRDGEDWSDVVYDMRNPQVTHTVVDPAIVDHHAFRLLLQLHLAGHRLRGFTPHRMNGTDLRGRSLDGSWFELDDPVPDAPVPGPDAGYRVRQGGSHRLWDTVEAAYAAWQRLGHPAPERFTVVAGASSQYIRCTARDSGEWRWPLPL